MAARALCRRGALSHKECEVIRWIFSRECLMQAASDVFDQIWRKTGANAWQLRKRVCVSMPLRDSLPIRFVKYGLSLEHDFIQWAGAELGWRLVDFKL